MPLITITSDLGIKDFYVAALKGAIITHCGYVPIIDISHSVRHFDIKEAAFLIGNGYKYFPKGTIHIVHVGSNEARGKLLVAIIDGYYFITFDNGILSMVFDKTFPQQVYQVNEELLENHTLLYEDAIAKVIGLLLQEYRLSDFGQPLTETVHYRLLQPITTQGGLKGSVIDIDHF